MSNDGKEQGALDMRFRSDVMAYDPEKHHVLWCTSLIDEAGNRLMIEVRADEYVFISIANQDDEVALTKVHMTKLRKMLSRRSNHHG